MSLLVAYKACYIFSVVIQQHVGYPILSLLAHMNRHTETHMVFAIPILGNPGLCSQPVVSYGCKKLKRWLPKHFCMKKVMKRSEQREKTQGLNSTLGHLESQTHSTTRPTWENMVISAKMSILKAILVLILIIILVHL